MKIARPFIISDAALIETNVVETAPAAYNPATPYALDATCSVGTVGQLLTIYTSLQAANTGHDPAGSPEWWKATGTCYAEYNADATYALDDILQVSATHKVYQSLADANTGNPVTDATKWLDPKSATNRWRMFDNYVTSRTTNPDIISCAVTITGRIDTVSLRNVSAAWVRAVMTDAIDGVVYDRTINMIANMGINNLYDYFFEPIERESDCLFTGLPPYANATVQIILSDPGNVVACGHCVLAQSRFIGGTRFGMALGIDDYSAKERTPWGDLELVERDYSDNMNLVVVVDNNYVNRCKNQLAEYRAIPILYIGEDTYTSSVMFGVFRSFNIVVERRKTSICNIEIESFI